MARGWVFACFCLLSSASAAKAVEILEKEPPAGALRRGEVAYVDDGKCPKGQVTRLTAGSLAGGGPAQRGAARPRGRSCVPRPM